MVKKEKSCIFLAGFLFVFFGVFLTTAITICHKINSVKATQGQILAQPRTLSLFEIHAHSHLRCLCLQLCTILPVLVTWQAHLWCSTCCLALSPHTDALHVCSHLSEQKGLNTADTLSNKTK